MNFFCTYMGDLYIQILRRYALILFISCKLLEVYVLVHSVKFIKLHSPQQRQETFVTMVSVAVPTHEVTRDPTSDPLYEYI